MKISIALFRGINVGGKNTLPMKELAAVLEDLGCRNVATYIQSGNAVFEHQETVASELADRISAEVRNRRGFEPRVLLLGLKELEQAIEGNPFPQAAADPRTLHIGFLASRPKNPDLKTLASLKKETEEFQLVGKVFYLQAPEGVGRSKLAASSERLLGVPMTDRNWNTVCKIREMAALM